ncbi:hypothetical protein [Croceicoccus gelatinilyticus]|uniref:hypothetical protein n=1 Tax=Croceicoccus gelatinilyticus TaxID=2835536 RepID=UPI001BD1B291|nr:hypothetical protein [Croceicoccus gelatinilyticus]MBS7668804.1 hypothetical protein [Croceicoccus gelatinilyticus]
MDMKKTCGEIAAAWAEIDFSEENAKVAALQADIAKAEDAIAKAEARSMELSQALFGRRHHDGQAVADALLSDVEVAEAARLMPSFDEMQDERAALQAGIRSLRHKIQDKNAEIDALRGAARSRLAVHVGPLTNALTAEAAKAAQVIVDAYAAIDAISYGLGKSAPEQECLRIAAKGVVGSRALLPQCRSAQVPSEISGLFGPLLDKGPAVKVRQIRSFEIAPRAEL